MPLGKVSVYPHVLHYNSMITILKFVGLIEIDNCFFKPINKIYNSS